MRILIAGGGIAGLTAALALLRRGVEVQVLEQAHELREVGAGVQVSANGMRVFADLGIAEEVLALAARPSHREVRLWNTGQAWVSFDLGAASLARYGQPYVTLYRPDLVAVLESAVRRADPGCIRLGQRAIGCGQSSGAAMLRLADGSVVEGDALIGADGIHSAIRAQLHGASEAEFTGCVAWRGVIPTEALPAHLALPIAANWVGPGRHMVHYPLRGGALTNVVGVVEREDWLDEGWTTPGTHPDMLADFAGWHADVQSLIHAIPQPFLWALKLRRPLPRWTEGRITLLGDACHPTLPFMAQGAVMAIEDGLVLARALTDIAEVPRALRAYEAARHERTTRVVEGSAANTRRYHNPILGDPARAAAHVEQELAAAPAMERFDWLYRYDATTSPIPTP